MTGKIPNTELNDEQTLYLAPLQGYTEIEFRRAWSNLFYGLDLAIAPFIPLTEGLRFRNKHLHDVIPEQNTRIPVIPQVLGNEPKKFLYLATKLHDLGYAEMNWNLGCPKKEVTKKKRGSGLLPYPDMIRDILEKVIPHIPVKLSVKTRLGYHEPDEFFRLVEVYNEFPLARLVIHPRTSMQHYEGELHLDTMDQVIGHIRHRVVFSGDITDLKSFRLLKNKYPAIKDWMTGRGVLTNPFLPEWLNKGVIDRDDQQIRNLLNHFFEEMFCEIREKFRFEKSVLNKMKDYWSFFSRWFVNDQYIFNRLARLNSLEQFRAEVRHIFDNEPLAPMEGRSNRALKTSKQVI